MSLLFLLACPWVPSMQTPPAETPTPSFPADLPHRLYTIGSRAEWLEVRRAVEREGNVPAVVEVVVGPGDIDWPISLDDLPAAYLILRGTAPATVLHESLDLRDIRSVEVRDLRFGASEWTASALTVRATHSITLHNLSFLDQIGAPTIPTRGALSMDQLAALTVEKGGAIALSDVTILGARGAWPAVRMVAPKGTVTIARTLVAGGDRPPFFVGTADALTVEDSVLVAPAGKELIQSVWPPGAVTIRRSTLVADTPEVVHPGNNPQAPPSRYLPPRASDTTFYVRTRAPGDVPAPDGATIRPASTDTPDLALLRARAEVLAPVDRAAVTTLLGLHDP